VSFTNLPTKLSRHLVGGGSVSQQASVGAGWLPRQ
jgi:hypothetical protein